MNYQLLNENDKEKSQKKLNGININQNNHLKEIQRVFLNKGSIF